MSILKDIEGGLGAIGNAVAGAGQGVLNMIAPAAQAPSRGQMQPIVDYRPAMQPAMNTNGTPMQPIQAQPMRPMPIAPAVIDPAQYDVNPNGGTMDFSNPTHIANHNQMVMQYNQTVGSQPGMMKMAPYDVPYAHQSLDATGPAPMAPGQPLPEMKTRTN